MRREPAARHGRTERDAVSGTGSQQDGELVVLFHDDAIIAVDKPAGIIVHGDGTGAETLTDLLRAHLREQGLDKQADEAQPLMRLDRDTTGIVLFSIDKATQPAFDRLIAEHRAEKRYLAIIEGAPRWRQRTFDGPIGRDRHDSRRMRVSRTGKPALTRATVLAHNPSARPPLALLDVLLETGRKHQIRVHLSDAGLPIAGDALYNPSHGTAGRDRQGLMLHATRSSFAHPLTGEKIVIEAPYPERFRAYFDPP